MVVIRLRRAGSKKRPFFRVVATDSHSARDGRFIEILGHYNPRTNPAVVRVNQARVDYWLQRGAQASDSVRTLIARHLTPTAAASAEVVPKTAVASDAGVAAEEAVVAPDVAAAAAPADEP